LSKARKNLDYQAIKEFADMSAETACQIDDPLDNVNTLWHTSLTFDSFH